MNLPCCWWQHMLPASYLKCSWKEGETGDGRVKNGSAFYPSSSKFGELCTEWIQMKMSIFEKEVAVGWSGSQGILPWHHKSVVEHVNHQKTLHFGEFFWMGYLWMHSHHGCWHFCVFHVSQFAVQWGFIIKLGNVVIFLSVPWCNSIAKIAYSFVWMTSFEKQQLSLGDWQANFSVMRRTELSSVSQKWVIA